MSIEICDIIKKVISQNSSYEHEGERAVTEQQPGRSMSIKFVPDDDITVKHRQQ